MLHFETEVIQYEARYRGVTRPRSDPAKYSKPGGRAVVYDLVVGVSLSLLSANLRKRVGRFGLCGFTNR